MNIRLRCLLPVVLVIAACAHAADLKVTVETANLRLRKDAPIPLEVRFENPGSRLLQGRLEFTLLIGDRKAGVHRSAELVLQPGSRTVPILLPPPQEAHPSDGIAARLRWLGADGVRDLGEQHIGIYGSGGHEVVLAIARTERRLSDVDTARDASLKLESLRPTLDAAGWLTFTTLHANVAAQNLPTHPLGWCAYDAMFLDGPAFAATNEKQLIALARWVEAGGSVGVCTDAPVSERHLAFLNRLGASEVPAIPFTLDQNGFLTRGAVAPFGVDPKSDAARPRPILLRPGLGRAFIAFDAGSTPKAFDRNEWRAAVAWLWKLSESEQREVAKTGRWSKDLIRNNQGWRGPDEIELSSVWGAAAGFNALTPGAPKQMPLSVVALVLGALLVIVGPADWLALGWMRRRRWTWFVFPVVCAGFAWLTAHLAGKYLGVEDRSGRVRFVDLADNGRPLREVRYEMLLPARDRDWKFDLRDAIAAPVPRSPADHASNAPPDLARAAAANADSISEWPSPGHFILRRTLRQWSPAMVRITSFPSTTDGPQPDWESAAGYFQDPKTAAESWSRATRAIFLHEPRQQVVASSAGSWSSAKGTMEEFQFEIPRRDGDEDMVPRDRDDFSFVRWLAFGKDRRILGGLATATSPQLAGTSDLVQEREWSRDRRVLCAWRRAGGELLIYRRSFPAK